MREPDLVSDKGQKEGGVEVGVVANGGNLTMDVSHGLRRGRAGMADDGRRQQAEGKGSWGDVGGWERLMLSSKEDSNDRTGSAGGSRQCILLTKGMAMEEVLRLVMGIRGSDLREGKLWYGLKYDRQMSMAIEGDVDVRMILKGNDEHGHLYVGGKEGPKRLA
ncbi:LOW QUALITY PROTEIN: hypothetical protein Cgig2_013109 [Carnegiea gigantea]|uniref:Uncharacterized protein n=1 Tax=Carnegiea gigantea TaxID=171969 RepID=A0A9Q1KRF6_9CARY|nr:LOW QUALITY PROTEIN: hypothetical protein Cgig2_013109 [Carnegiea gigantea]